MNSIEAKRGFTTFVILSFLITSIVTLTKKIADTRTKMQPQASGVSGNLINPQITNLAGTSAEIVWETDVPTTGRVEYGLTSDLCEKDENNCSVVESPLEATFHSVKLKSLIPKSRYYYKIYIGDSPGQNSPLSFNTPSPEDTSGLAGAGKSSAPVSLFNIESEKVGEDKTLTLEGFYSAVAAYDERYDGNNDGVINTIDLNILKIPY